MARSKIIYEPIGTCSQLMELEVVDGIIADIKIMGGCAGSLHGLSRLITGMRADDAIKRLEGITCGTKSTSCPDQLAKALKQMNQ